MAYGLFSIDPLRSSFFVIAFASYVESSEEDFTQSFADWLKVGFHLHYLTSDVDGLGQFNRQGQRFPSTSNMSKHLLCTDVIIPCSQIKFLRKTSGSRLNVFNPVNDLSSLSKSGSEERSLVPGKKNDVAIAGGQILGDEYSDHVVKVLLPLAVR